MHWAVNHLSALRHFTLPSSAGTGGASEEAARAAGVGAGRHGGRARECGPAAAAARSGRGRCRCRSGSRAHHYLHHHRHLRSLWQQRGALFDGRPVLLAHRAVQVCVRLCVLQNRCLYEGVPACGGGGGGGAGPQPILASNLDTQRIMEAAFFLFLGFLNKIMGRARVGSARILYSPRRRWSHGVPALRLRSTAKKWSMNC